LNDVNDRRKEKVQYRYKVSRLCSAGPSPIEACLGLECVYFVLIVCVLIVLIVLYCPSVSYLTHFNVVRGLIGC
jgi:hypothetical protein